MACKLLESLVCQTNVISQKMDKKLNILTHRPVDIQFRSSPTKEGFYIYVWSVL